jgi:hypothetical protein
LLIGSEEAEPDKMNPHNLRAVKPIKGWHLNALNGCVSVSQKISLIEPFEKETPGMARLYQLMAAAGSFFMEEISDEKSESCLSAIKKGNF